MWRGARRLASSLAFDRYLPKTQQQDGDPGRTIVFLHGVLGTKRNWRTPANLFLKSNPGFQALAVDHRAHGGSYLVDFPSGNTVSTCAQDLERLVCQEMGPVSAPEILSAHSFGGKVALLWLEQRLLAGRPLPRHTFVLDSMPGPYLDDARQDPGNSVHGIFAILEALPATFSSSKEAVALLQAKGVSLPIAQWLASGCFSPAGSDGNSTWGFDLPVCAALFQDFCQLDLRPLLEQFDGRGRALGGGDAHIHMVRAGKNRHWTPALLAALTALERRGGGVRLHTMANCGHWLHVDDVEGLVRLLSEQSSMP